MAFETRVSSRTDPTPKAFEHVNRGVIKCRKIAIAQGPTDTDIDPGPQIRSMICKNTGSFDVRIRFNSDAASNYWELAPGDTSPEFHIRATTVIHTRGISGASELQCILWG